MNLKNNLKKQGKAARKKRKIIAYVLFGILAFIVVCFVGFIIVKASGKMKLSKNVVEQAPVLEAASGDTEVSTEQGNYVYKDGQKYEYNKDLVTILFMGIDSSTKSPSKTQNMGQSGQSDAIFLMVLDTKKNTMKIVGIPRDTMTSIDIYDKFGKYFDTVNEHLALQYAYGDGKDFEWKIYRNIWRLWNFKL